MLSTRVLSRFRAQKITKLSTAAGRCFSTGPDTPSPLDEDTGKHELWREGKKLIIPVSASQLEANRNR